jgi:hypothetical protein
MDARDIKDRNAKKYSRNAKGTRYDKQHKIGKKHPSGKMYSRSYGSANGSCCGKNRGGISKLDKYQNKQARTKSKIALKN